MHEETTNGSAAKPAATSAPTTPQSPPSGRIKIRVSDLAAIPAVKLDRFPDLVGKAGLVLPVDGRNLGVVLDERLAAVLAGSIAMLGFIASFGPNCPAAPDIISLMKRCGIELVR